MAVEIRADDEYMMQVLGKITDMKTLLTVSAERAFMRKLDGGCSTPVGCNATFEDGKVCPMQIYFPRSLVEGFLIMDGFEDVKLYLEAILGSFWDV